jgi:hypothetical protein
MSSFLLVGGAAVVSIVLSLSYRGFRSRVRRGHYEENAAGQGPSFVTNEGTFVVNKATQTLDIVLSSGTFHLPFGDILSLQLEHRVREALGEELLFERFSLLDLHRKYRDHIHSYRIVIKTQTRGEVPLFEAAQYEVRDFLDFTTPIQLWLLGVMGLHRKADVVAEEVLGKIQRQLSRGGVQVAAGRW